MSLVKIIKRLLPKTLKKKLRRYLFIKACKACYRYDLERYIEYSNAFSDFKNRDKLIGLVTAEYHVIEKGLTMSNMRLGFGTKVMENLIKHCELFGAQLCGNSNEQFYHAISVIAEYRLVHEKSNYTLDEKLLFLINDILSKYNNVTPAEQILMTKTEYFKHAKSSFEDFSNSRHSLRSYSGTIETAHLEKAIKLAQNAPSACNRQPSRVYIVQDKTLIKQVLSVQNGNRGFGHLADKLIILTAELGGYLSIKERNDVYVNGGIYAMNLLYALHYFQIGACTLNWCSLPEQDMELRKMCDIKSSETIVLLIACGGVPEKFKLTISHRNDYKKVLRVQ